MYGPPQFDPNGPQFQGGGGMPQGAVPPAQGPQPPQQMPPQQPQPQVPQTMGGVAQGAGVVQPQADPNDLMAQYAQAKAAADQVFASAKQQIPTPQPNHSLGWILMNALTFGAPAADQMMARNRQAHLINLQNHQVDLAASKMAFDIVKNQQDIAKLGTMQGLKQMELALRIKGMEEQKRKNDLTALRNLTVGPPKAGDLEALEANQPGSRYVPVPGAPTRYTIQPGAANGPGPAPGSRLDEAMGSPANRIRQNNIDEAAGKAQASAEARATIPTMTTRTMQERAPKVVNQARQILQDMRDLELGPLASRWREFQAGRVGVDDPAFTTYRTDAGLLPSLLMQMHTGNRSAEAIAKKFEGLIDYTHQSPANMKAALQAIIRYGTMVQGGHNPQDAADTVLGEAQSTEPTQPTGRTITLDEFLAQ